TIARFCPGPTPTTVAIHGTVHKPVDDGTKLCNQGQAKSDDVTVPVLSDDPATALPGDPTCATIVAGALFAGSTKTWVDTTGGAPPRPGHVIKYTLTLTNKGNGDAGGVTVTDPIDPSLTDVVPADGGTFAAGAITWTSTATPALAVVAIGQTVTLSFTAK